jgi:hypothetical protein
MERLLQSVNRKNQERSQKQIPRFACLQQAGWDDRIVEAQRCVTGLKTGHYNGRSSTLHCAATVIAEKAAAPFARLRKAPLEEKVRASLGCPDV